jgi:Na+/H+-dicarboxylate symporter
MTLAVRVLIGLVLGFLTGLALSAMAPQSVDLAGRALGPVGTVFVNLIRMTAIPLVASMLVASLGAMSAPGGLGSGAVRALAVACLLLTVTAAGSALVAVPVLSRLGVDPASGVALQSATSDAAATAIQASPGVTGWLVDLVPQNVVRAAADGAVLPVIFFAVLFGLALGRVADGPRLAVLRVAEGVAAVMQRIVSWILQVAPVGVFALAVPLASRMGLSMAGAVVAYVLLVVALTVVAVVMILYPIGILAGRMPASAFLAYCAPAQAIAFASRSSLASLPAAVESAERVGLAPAMSRFILPLAVSVFHFGAAVAQTVGVVFLAQLFGVTLSTTAIASIVAAVVLASFAVPSIPGGSIIALVPVLQAANLPLDGIGILLAVDTVPDMFRTTANLTGAMTLAAILPGDRR